MKLKDLRHVLTDVPLGTKYHVSNVGEPLKINSKFYETFEEFSMDDFLNDYIIVFLSISTSMFFTIFVKKA